MNIQSLLKSFTEKGILIWIDQEKVKYRAPKGIMKPSDIQTLKDNKNEIITYLNSKTKLKHDEKNRYKDFDLSDMQKAYAIGRQPQQELGGLGCKSYTEIKMPLLSPEKFERSWHKLIQNHDILQTIISDDLMHQHYEIKTYPKLKVNDYTNLGRDQKNFKYLNKRNELKRMQFSLDKFPLHHFELSMFENYTIIHFVVDMVIGDFMSVHKMIDEIIEIYNDEEIEYEELSFRDVVVFNQEKLKTTNEESLYYRDKNYWLDKIKEMPLQPELTVNPEAYNTDRPSFTRFDFKLTGEEWKKFKANCHSFNVTPSNAVLTIYKDLLQKRSLTDQFAINITLMNRYQFNEDISKVMGDFTSVNVLDTTTNKSNFKERALQIQNELLNNLDHKRFNGVEVLRELSKYHGENIIIPFVYTSTIGMPHDNNDKYEVIYGVSETPQVLIDCQVSEQNNTFTCHLDIRDNAFDTKFINAFIDEFQILLHEYAKDIKQWENESYFCSLSEKNIVKHHHHKIKIEDIDKRLSTLKLVDHSHTLKVNNDKNKHLKTYIVPNYEIQDVKLNDSLKAHLLTASKNAFENIDQQKFNKWKNLSDLTALTDILKVFRKVGIFCDVGEFLMIRDIFKKLEITSKYHMIVRRWLNALEKEHYIVYRKNAYALTYYGSNLVSENEKYWKEFESIENEIDYSSTMFNYQKDSSDQLLEQIQEKVNSLELFFPQGKTDIAMAAYNKNIINKGLNEITKNAIKNICNKKSGEISILEVGGGVAATTIEVLPSLDNFKIKYDFTDISQYFLSHGKEILKEYDYVNYRLFDINESYKSQGFKKQAYDIILCPNVLHNSKHALLVLNQLNEMLKPRGYLIMIEATLESYSLLTSLELKGGLDHFLDSRRHSNNTFFNRESWETMLKEAHFNPLVMLPERKESIYECGQSVIISQSLSPSLKNIENDIQETIEKWPKFMKPDYLEVTTQLPKSIEDRNIWKYYIEEKNNENFEEKTIIRPSYDLEKQLLKILEKVLEREDIGIEDNFYQIGGDSLLVAKLITEIRENVLEVKGLTFETLMKLFTKNPTVRALASQVVDQKKYSSSAYKEKIIPNHVKIFHQTVQQPNHIKALFHAGTGRLLDYNYLLPYLYESCNEQDAIYGFVYGDVNDYTSIQPDKLVLSLAWKYAETLMNTGAEEFELYGYCVGGFIAIETARILIENGKKVLPVNIISSHLCLHEIANPLLMEAAFANIIGADMNAVGYKFEFNDLQEALKHILQGETRDILNQELFELKGSYSDVGLSFKALSKLSQIDRLMRIYNSIPNQEFNGTNNSFEKLQDLYQVFNQTYLGMIHYSPEPFLGNIRVFNPIETLNDFYPKTKKDITWNDFVFGDINEKDIQGNHASCVEFEYVQSLANALEVKSHEN